MREGFVDKTHNKKNTVAFSKKQSLSVAEVEKTVLKTKEHLATNANNTITPQLRYQYTVMETRFILGTQCAVAMLAAGDRKLVLVSNW